MGREAEAPIVNPIHAREGEWVDIHWRLKNGAVLVERRSCPPRATVAEQLKQAAEALETKDPQISRGFSGE